MKIKNKVKKTIAILITTSIIVTTMLAGCTKQIEYTELGIPSAERFAQGKNARVVWDMKVWQDKLYIGGGDYGENTAPTDIWCYDFCSRSWNLSASVEDEAVIRFVEINNQLVVPGVDPKEDWSLGNYYILNDNNWTKKRNIVGAIHNFDMVMHKGMLFAGLGVETSPNSIYPKVHPVACSKDGGQTFEQVMLYKNGQEIDFLSKSSVVRTYEFLVCEDNLYAIVRIGEKDNTDEFGLFCYEQGKMNYVCDFSQKITLTKTGVSLFLSKAEFKGKTFVTTGHLYSTSDAQNYTRIDLDGKVVCDLLVKDNLLYALCFNKESTGKTIISVYQSSTGNLNDFTKTFSFEYDVAPISFEKHQSEFYIGMGERDEINDLAGMVLKVRI